VTGLHFGTRTQGTILGYRWYRVRWFLLGVDRWTPFIVLSKTVL
jgi:hypothetical protein